MTDPYRGYPYGPNPSDDATVRIPGPPGAPAPMWGSPPPPPRGRGPNVVKWAALTSAVVAVIAVTVAVVVSVRGGESSNVSAEGQAPAAPTGAGAAGADLLDQSAFEAAIPSSDALLNQLGLPPSSEVKHRENIVDAKYPVDAQCGPVATPFDAVAYRGSGYASVRYLTVRDPADGKVDATRVSWVGGALFPNVTSAAAAFNKVTSAMQSCAGMTVNLKSADDDGDSFWIVGKPVTDADGIVTIVNTGEGGDGWRCGRAVALRTNVIAESVDCKIDAGTDGAVGLVKLLTAKIGGPQ